MDKQDLRENYIHKYETMLLTEWSELLNYTV